MKLVILHEKGTIISVAKADDPSSTLRIKFQPSERQAAAEVDVEEELSGIPINELAKGYRFDQATGRLVKSQTETVNAAQRAVEALIEAPKSRATETTAGSAKAKTEPPHNRLWTPCVVGRLALESLFLGAESGAPDVAALGHALVRTGQHFAEQAFANAIPDLAAMLFDEELWSPELILPWRDFANRQATAPGDDVVVHALAVALVRTFAKQSVDPENLSRSFWNATVKAFRDGATGAGFEFEDEEEDEDDHYNEDDDPYVFIKVLSAERIDKLPLVGPEQKPLYCIQPENNSSFTQWADTIAATELPDKIHNRLVILKTSDHSVNRGYVVNKWSANLIDDHPPLYTELIGTGDELAIYRWDLYEGDLSKTKIDDLIDKAREKLQGEEEKLTGQASTAAKDKVSELAGDAVQQIAQALGGAVAGMIGGAAGAKIGEEAGKLAGEIAGKLVKAMIDVALDALADRAFAPVYVTLFTHYSQPKAPFCLASAISGNTLLKLSRPGTVPNPPVEGPIGHQQTDAQGHPTGDNPHSLFDEKPSAFRAQQPPTSRWWFGASIPAARSSFRMWWARWVPAVAWRDLMSVGAGDTRKLKRQRVSVFSWGGHRFASHGFGVYVRQSVAPAKVFTVVNFMREGICEVALRADTRWVRSSELNTPPSEPK